MFSCITITSDLASTQLFPLQKDLNSDLIWFIYPNWLDSDSIKFVNQSDITVSSSLITQQGKSFITSDWISISSWALRERRSFSGNFFSTKSHMCNIFGIKISILLISNHIYDFNLLASLVCISRAAESVKCKVSQLTRRHTLQFYLAGAVPRQCWHKFQSNKINLLENHISRTMWGIHLELEPETISPIGVHKNTRTSW